MFLAEVLNGLSSSHPRSGEAWWADVSLDSSDAL